MKIDQNADGENRKKNRSHILNTIGTDVER